MAEPAQPLRFSDRIVGSLGLVDDANGGCGGDGVGKPLVSVRSFFSCLVLPPPSRNRMLMQSSNANGSLHRFTDPEA